MLGLRPEQRLLLFMANTPDFVTLFLAAMRIGAILVPVSTMVRPDGPAGLLRVLGGVSNVPVCPAWWL